MHLRWLIKIMQWNWNKWDESEEKEKESKVKQEIIPLQRNSSHRDSSSYYRGTTDLALSSKGTRPVINFTMFCSIHTRGSGDWAPEGRFSCASLEGTLMSWIIHKASEFPVVVSSSVTQGDLTQGLTAKQSPQERSSLHIMGAKWSSSNMKFFNYLIWSRDKV